MDVSSRPHLETFEGFVFLLHLTPIGERIVRKSYSLKTLYALQSICSKFAARFTGLTILEPFLDRHCKAVWEASSKLARKHEMGHKCSMCPHPRRNRRKRSNRSPEVVPGCHLCRSKKTDPIHYKTFTLHYSYLITLQNPLQNLGELVISPLPNVPARPVS